jgi:hypothetical protein
MSPTLRTLGRRVVVTLALAGVALLALLAPIPTSGNSGCAVLMSQLEQRLPGWHLVRASESWESAFTVVAECGGRLVGFQYVPEHGLPAGDAWLQPDDDFSRSRLAEVTDSHRYLVWRQRPRTDDSLSCREEIARDDGLLATDGRRVD